MVLESSIFFFCGLTQALGVTSSRTVIQRRARKTWYKKMSRKYNLIVDAMQKDLRSDSVQDHSSNRKNTKLLPSTGLSP